MSESWASLDGASIYVESVGEGPPGLMMPVAWGASHEFYRTLLGELEIPLRLIHFDAEGTGASGPLPAGWNPARIVDEAEAVRKMVVGDEPVIVIGHASGAFMALAYALEYPEWVKALVLISPFAGYQRANDMSVARVESHPQWSTFRQRVKEITRVKMAPAERFRAIFKEQRVIDMYDYGPHYFQMADAADETDFNPAMTDDAETDLLEELSSITAPALIVTGEDDPLSPLEECRLMAGELPYVRLIEFANCGHYPFVEEPELFTKALEDFLAEVAEDD